MRSIAAALLLVLALLALRRLTPAPERQLATYDTEHAVADADNAARIYAEILQGQGEPADKLAAALTPLVDTLVDAVTAREQDALLHNLHDLQLSEGITDPNAAKTMGWRPWKAAECPEMKQWLDRRRHYVDRLQEATQKPFCRFPVSVTPGHMSLLDVPLGAFSQCVFLLTCAANNELGEGDVSSGLAKYEALIVLGQHLRQQPGAHHLLTGIVCEGGTIYRLTPFVVDGSADERHLSNFAACCGDLEDRWESLRGEVNRVRGIYSRLLADQRPAIDRVYTWYRRTLRGDNGWSEDHTHDLYLRLLADRRGLRLLIELRRFKDRTGRWPESLDSIASSLPPQALLDPISGYPFVYRLSEHGFLLYGIGPNRIDEKGQRRQGGPDDWRIWPPRGDGSSPKPKRATDR
jgi:hypothetical protein